MAEVCTMLSQETLRYGSELLVSESAIGKLSHFFTLVILQLSSKLTTDGVLLPSPPPGKGWMAILSTLLSLLPVTEAAIALLFVHQLLLEDRPEGEKTLRELGFCHILTSPP